MQSIQNPLNSPQNEQLTTLVFDWGDTLMVNYPQYDGPMLYWPKVDATPGSLEALQSLHGRYRIVVATNAEASTAEQIRAAFERVGLDGYIDDIYTMHELKARKPEGRFYEAIERLTGACHRQVIMIGDHYYADVLGARQMHWPAIWYNPYRIACPGGLPVHNAEIVHLAQLPDALQRLKIPDWPTCQHWVIDQSTAPGLWGHVQAVASVAYLLAVWLRSAGEEVDPILAHRGGLLHDLAKLTARRSEYDHGEAAARWLLLNDQPELAEIARRHMLFNLLDEKRQPYTWEQKLVYLADKLVEGAAIAGLEERIAALRQRYQIADAPLEQCLPRLYALQDELCQRLGITPEEMLQRLTG